MPTFAVFEVRAVNVEIAVDSKRFYSEKVVSARDDLLPQFSPSLRHFVLKFIKIRGL